MERLTSVGTRWTGWLVHLGSLAVAVAWLFLLPNRYELFNAELLGAYLIAVIGLNLLLQAGLISVGHSALFGVGGYTVAILTVKYGVNYFAALVAAAILAGAIGFVLGVPALRLGLFTLVMVTFGYALIIQQLIVEFRRLTGGPDGLPGVRFPTPFADAISYYVLILLIVVIAYVVAHNLIRSPFGRASKATEQQAIAAQSLGIDVYLVRLRAFVISSVFAGVAGGVYVPLLGFASPDTFTADLAILLLLMALVGGAGTLAGPIVGAMVLLRLPISIERITQRSGDWSLLVYGVILLFTVHFIPRGLMTAWYGIRGRFLKVAPPSIAVRTSDLSVALPVAVPGAQRSIALRASGIGKNLGGVQALSSIDIEVEEATVHALIGPNGSGKTTFLNTVSGFLRADTGSVELLGVRIDRRRPVQRARIGLGRTFQTPLVFERMSCLENVMAALDAGRKRSHLSYLLRLPAARREERERYRDAVTLLTAVGMEDRAEHEAADLPPGERRLLEIARVAALKPRLVLMDEPAAGLSGREITELERIIAALKAHGTAVLLVEHHVDMVMRIADKVTVIDFGRVIARGRPDEVQRNPVVLEAYLGTPAKTA